MSYTRLIKSNEGKYGLVVADFLRLPKADAEFAPNISLVLWEGDATAIPVRAQTDKMFVQGSIALAVDHSPSNWELWVRQNPEKTFLECLAEVSILTSSGKSAKGEVSKSMVRNRWVKASSDSGNFENVKTNLDDQRLIVGKDKIKLLVEPKQFFDHASIDSWWLLEPAASIVQSYSPVASLLSPNFFELHQILINAESEVEKFDDILSICELAEMALSELGIEEGGKSTHNESFKEYFLSLRGSSKIVLEQLLILIWGKSENLHLNRSEVLSCLLKKSPEDIGKYRSFSAALRWLFEPGTVQDLDSGNMLELAALACEAGIAVNFKSQIEKTLGTIPLEEFAGFRRSHSGQIARILEFLGFDSELGRSLLVSLNSEADELFASQVFWAPLKTMVLTPQILSSLSRPLGSKILKRFVLESFEECLNRSDFQSVSLALADNQISKQFVENKWALWLAQSLGNESSGLGAQILEIISNSQALQSLTAENGDLSSALTRAKDAQATITKELENSKAEVTNLVRQLEQMRLGIQASVDSQSGQQEKDLMVAIAKLLATAGSLPNKVDPGVYMQFLQQVKILGLHPIGAVGEELVFNPKGHNFRGNDGQVGEKVKVLAPGYEYRNGEIVEVIWKAQVTRS